MAQCTTRVTQSTDCGCFVCVCVGVCVRLRAIVLFVCCIRANSKNNNEMLHPFSKKNFPIFRWDKAIERQREPWADTDRCTHVERGEGGGRGGLQLKKCGVINNCCCRIGLNSLLQLPSIKFQWLFNNNKFIRISLVICCRSVHSKFLSPHKNYGFANIPKLIKFFTKETTYSALDRKATNKQTNKFKNSVLTARTVEL